ncbi:MAG: hypothetical protein M3540_03795 [Actinomycetota bacterium]|nr:hypothetical protein [Actinomycetota bacterium]
MNWTVALGIAAIAGTVAAGYLSARAVRQTAAQQAERDQRAELAAALTEFFAGAIIYASEVRDIPRAQPRAVAARVTRAADWFRGEGAAWVLTQKQLREVLGDRPAEIGDRIITAYARLHVLGLRPELLKPFEEFLDYAVKLANERTDEVKSEWGRERAKLLAAIAAVSAATDPLMSERTRLEALGVGVGSAEPRR